jgi:hypothetical protein
MSLSVRLIILEYNLEVKCQNFFNLETERPVPVCTRLSMPGSMHGHTT